MTEGDRRSITSIREELTAVNSLILKHNDFIELYPEDDGLKISLNSYKFRRTQLVNELVDARSITGKSTFNFHFDGQGIKNNFMPLSAMSEFFGSLQDIVTALVNKSVKGDTAYGKISDEIKRRSELTVIDVESGSFQVIVGGNDFEYFDEPDYIKALIKLNSMLDCKNDKDKIKKMRKEIGPRAFNKYKKLINSLKNNKLNLIMYDRYGKEKLAPMKINRDEAEEIALAINEVDNLPEERVVIRGTFTAEDLRNRKVDFMGSDGQIIRSKIVEGLPNSVIHESMDIEVDGSKVVDAEFVVSTKYHEIEDKEIKEWELINIVIIK